MKKHDIMNLLETRGGGTSGNWLIGRRLIWLLNQKLFGLLRLFVNCSCLDRRQFHRMCSKTAGRSCSSGIGASQSVSVKKGSWSLWVKLH